MGFKERTLSNNKEANEYFGKLLEEVFNGSTPQGWRTTKPAHEEDELTYGEVSNKDEESDIDTIDLNSTPLEKKLELIVHSTLDGLLLGNIALENAQELVELVTAVYNTKAVMEKQNAK